MRTCLILMILWQRKTIFLAREFRSKLIAWWDPALWLIFSVPKQFWICSCNLSICNVFFKHVTVNLSFASLKKSLFPDFLLFYLLIFPRRINPIKLSVLFLDLTNYLANTSHKIRKKFEGNNWLDNFAMNSWV